MAANVPAQTKTWLKELEGLRGLASLWVFSTHATLMCGTQIHIVSHGTLGVDLFILLSGFLMAHNYEQRKLAQPWTSTKTIWQFWIRRYFRIAPLYYVLLAASMAIGSLLYSARSLVIEHNGLAVTDLTRYTDHSWTNIWTHASFIFGFLPQFASHTAIPDWSIGLEMQFYLVFPFLMLIVLRYGYIRMACATILASILANFLATQFFASFPHSSFLPLRINIFLLGMMIAATYHQKARLPAVFAVFLPMYSLLLKTPQENSPGLAITRSLMALGLMLVILDLRQTRAVAAPFRAFLNWWPCQKLGDISYSVYLVHELVVIPVSARLLAIPRLAALSPYPRFAVFFAADAVIVIPLSILLYHSIEKPGIALGKRLLQSWQTSPTAKIEKAAI